MHTFLHLLLDSLLNAVQISGLVVVMMMLIECFNVESHGSLFSALRGSRFSQVFFSALLGMIPGCMGGFASVSLYTHGMISLGALIAMMIATSGDEAFVMLASFPDDAMKLFFLLFAIAMAVGLLVDLIWKKPLAMHCDEHFEIHRADDGRAPSGRSLGWKRLLMLVFVILFALALGYGLLSHEEDREISGGFNFLSETWMNVMFALLCAVLVAVLIFANDHFVEEHLWHHIVVKHLPSIFAWTFGVMAFIGVGLHYLDISRWISSNIPLMILLAAFVGIIPESGPHLVFVSLYASGLVPLPVLLASCISQDGHAALPLLAESKKSFVRAKAINCIVAIAAGFIAMIFVH